MKDKNTRSLTEFILSPSPIWLSLILLVLLLIIRNIGLHTSVMADEWFYSNSTRNIPLSESNIPSYLYFLTYRITKLFDEEFLNLSRIINIIFFTAALPFIYLVSKKFTSRTISLFITSIIAISPLNSYTAFFMPESMYFFAFWVFSWLAFQYQSINSIKFAAISGVSLGLMSLIKVHALFLAPGFLLYFTLMYTALNKKIQLKSCCLSALTFILAIILTKILISYALVGKQGITLFGSFYQGAATSIKHDNHYINQLISNFLIVFKGHMLTLSLLFSVPLASLFYFRESFKSPNFNQLALRLYTLTVFASLLFVVVVFTGVFAISDVGEVTRLHMRYYDFAFPLLLIFTASQLSNKSNHFSLVGTLLPVCIIGSLMIYASYHHLLPYRPNFIDCPYALGLYYNKKIFYVLCFISFLSLALWSFNKQLGLKFFLFLYVPLSTIIFSFYDYKQVEPSLHMQVSERAGKTVREYLNDEDISKLVIAGPDKSQLYRALFYVDNPRAFLLSLQTDKTIDFTAIPKNKTWVLLISNNAILDNNIKVRKFNGFSLIKLDNSINVKFTKTEWSGINGHQGLSTPEQGMTWSDSKKVVLAFDANLPQNFILHLKASAFGPNVSKPIFVHYGSEVKQFTLTASPNEIAIPFNNKIVSNKIEIDIPEPTSPKSLKLSEDDRKLGVAFFELKIIPEETK